MSCVLSAPGVLSWEDRGQQSGCRHVTQLPGHLVTYSPRPLGSWALPRVPWALPRVPWEVFLTDNICMQENWPHV